MQSSGTLPAAGLRLYGQESIEPRVWGLGCGNRPPPRDDLETTVAD